MLTTRTDNNYGAVVCRLIGLHLRSPRKYIGLQLIDRPQRDGRLSWPGWMTHSGQLVLKVVTYQLQIGSRAGKVRRPETDVLTPELRCR